MTSSLKRLTRHATMCALGGGLALATSWRRVPFPAIGRPTGTATEVRVGRWIYATLFVVVAAVTLGL